MADSSPQRWLYTWQPLDLTTGLVGDPRNPRRETINELGARGWELVTVIALPAGNDDSPTCIAFFKRPSSEPT